MCPAAGQDDMSHDGYGHDDHANSPALYGNYGSSGPPPSSAASGLMMRRLCERWCADNRVVSRQFNYHTKITTQAARAQQTNANAGGTVRENGLPSPLI